MLRNLWRSLSGAAKVGIVIALVAFVIKINKTEIETVNGNVGSCSYIDYFAILAGVACLAIGFLLWRTVTVPESPGRRAHMILGAALPFVGVVHLLRGFGVILSPC